MDLVFDIGSESEPVGHALVYFMAADGTVFGTYVQTYPIPMNLAQYLPQVFASMVPTEQIDSEAATAMPPVAQEIEGGIDWLRATAEVRRDDLVNAGGLYSTDPVNLMGMTQEAVALYSSLFRSRAPIQTAPTSQPTINRYADLTEGERLAELTKLVGRARDLVDGSPPAEVTDEMHTLASSLPTKYRGADLVSAALTPGDVGEKLANLYIDRAYKLLNEDYLQVGEIETQIRTLEKS